MKRRDFLQKTALAGTIILSNDDTKLNFLPKKKPKSVVIIGAGFAGLSAGYALKKEGIKVTILESQNRIGGRVFSHSPEGSPNMKIELGAEWVGASHERIKSLCDEFGLELLDNTFESDLILNGNHSKFGKWSFSEKHDEFWNNKSALWEKISDADKENLDKTDWWRYLQQLGIDERDLLIRELLDSTDFGESIRHTSGFAAFAEYAESSEKNEMDLKIKGGNSMLAEKLADHLGRENILLQHHVLEINQKNSTVSIICKDNKVFECDKLICAIPTQSIMKIAWKPLLPKPKIEALQALQYARIGKFPIVFTERFWQREDFDMITDTPAHYFYHGTKNQKGKSGALVCYAIGEKAEVLASVSKQQRVKIIKDALRPAFGDLSKFIKSDLSYYWGKNPYTSGAYAFYGKSQWFSVRPILQEPFENTFFAGEHIADWQGFMEGAINTGEQAASDAMSV